MVWIKLSLSLSLFFFLCPLPLSRTFANVHLGDTDSFQVNHVYRDANTYTVVSAASEVLGKLNLVCVCVCVCVCVYVGAGVSVEEGKTERTVAWFSLVWYTP